MNIKLKKIRITYTKIVAFLVCIATVLDISYLNIVISNISTIKITYFVFTFLIEILVIIRKRIRIRNQHMFLALACVVVLGSTIINRGSVVNCLSIILPSVMVCLVVIACQNWKELNSVINIWCTIMYVLLIIDIASMLLYPNGLYRTLFDSRNWFLGFKTNRLSFIFPLVALYYFTTIKNRGTLSFKCIVLTILVIFDIVMSKGTAGTVAIVGYFVLVLLLMVSSQYKKNGKLANGLIRLFGKPSYFIPAYLMLTILVIIMQNQRIIHKMVVIFDKTETLGGRTIIWSRILNSLNGYWLFGKGSLTSTQYLQITGNVLNAHNVILTYLITGGTIGLILIIASIVSSTKASYDISNYILYIYIFMTLCIGITSSSLAFCPYFFAIILIPLSNAKTDQAKLGMATNHIILERET